MFIRLTNEYEIVQIIDSFKNKSSEDIHGLSMVLLKQVKDFIVKPLNYIFNVSLETGKFPDYMKVAKVLPLYKNNDKHNVSNYRPVSILPPFSKILEKIFEKRLRLFVDKNNVLFDGQYGFRTNRSTGFALNEMVDTIVKAIDNNKFCIGVFIDLKKAFDTVDHSLLIKKFKYYGVRGISSKFLESYLSNRTQFVSYKNVNSSEQNIRCGVPQGSIF